MWDFEWWRHPPTRDGVLPVVIWAVTLGALLLFGMELTMAALIAVGAMLVTSLTVTLFQRFTGGE